MGGVSVHLQRLLLVLVHPHLPVPVGVGEAVGGDSVVASAGCTEQRDRGGVVFLFILFPFAGDFPANMKNLILIFFDVC